MTPTESRPGGADAITETARDKVAERAPDMLWVSAALVETMVLVGGMLWIANGPGSIALPARILIIALCAVLGGGLFAFLAVRRTRS